ncbi:unnamed protein product [Acanthoscelides obtectus]|nr:unnamed protein product [Acanthoscelides obtectus]CAK1652877.1 hypothetical protein AOBTE_LOCUS17950 [Acanthoscelides obtectus]
MAVFEDFLKKYELKNMSKENRSYLPIAHIDALIPLKEKFKIVSKEIDNFLEAYRNKAKGDYKNLRTVASGDDKPTWDIVRNTELKKLLKVMEEESPDLWKDDLPTKEHMELILWAYSPDATKIKKNVSAYESKLGTGKKDEDEDMEEEDEKEDKKKSKKDKGSKRKSSTSDSGSEDEGSPKKKSKE